MDKSTKSEYEKKFAQFLAQAEEYGLTTGVPEHVDTRLLDAMDLTGDARTLKVRRAEQAMQIHVLATWAKGEAPGPPSMRNNENKAKKAESLASMFERKGDMEKAEYHRERAVRIREGTQPESEETP